MVEIYTRCYHVAVIISSVPICCLALRKVEARYLVALVQGFHQLSGQAIYLYNNVGTLRQLIRNIRIFTEGVGIILPDRKAGWPGKA